MFLQWLLVKVVEKFGLNCFVSIIGCYYVPL